MAILFYQNWPKEFITKYIFIHSGDTVGYYSPVEDFVDHGSYSTYCRMPGLLPLYAPLYALFGTGWGRVLVIILQFTFSTFSVYLLARTAQMIFKSERAFRFIFFIYAVSSFTSNWDHYGLSDSFGISFLVFGIYFLCRFKNSRISKDILISSFFLAWSVFFRPVHLVFFPVLAVIFLFERKQLKQALKNTLIFAIPVSLVLFAWTAYNFRKYSKLIFLQGPMTECFGSLTKEHLEIRKLIISWGGDYQPWSKNSAAEFLLNYKLKKTDPSAVKDHYLASYYNYDSLLVLRNSYREFVLSRPSDRKDSLGRAIIRMSGSFLNAYKAERPFQFYFMSRLRILANMLFPSRLDDFPTPPFNRMNPGHKLLKGTNYLLFLLVNVFGLIGCILMIYRKNWVPLIPLSVIIVITFVLGFTEQRYLTPSYPYLLVCSFPLVDFMLKKLMKKVE